METTTMYEISTECSCSILDEATGEETESTVCFGFCSDDQMEDFQFVLTDWFVPGTFRIEGFPVWYGTIGGLFDAKNPQEFLWSITPERTDWILRYNVEDDKFVGVLSHHDGTGTITVSKYEEQDDE